MHLWSVCKKNIPKDWIELVKGVLELSPQLQWNMYSEEGNKIIEQLSKHRCRKISQDKILGEGGYATIERRAVYDEHTLDLCHTAALNAWGQN